MSRVFVIGAGPMMDGAARRVTAHAVRTWHFVTALRRAGHDVTLSTVSTTISPSDPIAGLIEQRTKEGFAYENLDMRAGNMFAHLVERCHSLAPDCVVGVSSEPASWACRIGATVPVWADLHGWVMAEAQLKASAGGDDAALRHFWKQERPVLRRADVISTVSNPQRFALLGELATVGRLNRHNARHDLVVSVPGSVDAMAPQESSADNTVAQLVDHPGAFVLLWCGGFNTWTDVPVLFHAVEQAMARDPAIHFVATGGPIPGHADAVYETFQESVNTSPHRDRYHLQGWVLAEEFPGYLAGSHLALCVDFPCVETWTGTRTRLLEAMANGLPVLMTRGTELSIELEHAGIGWVVPPLDPRGFAEAILDRARDREQTTQMGRRSRAFVRDRYSIERTLEPLVQWAAQPVFAPDNELKREESPTILEAAVNDLEAAARALDSVEDVPSLVESRDEIDRLRRRWPFRWLLRRRDRGPGA